jgi:hypothetical protein
MIEIDEPNPPARRSAVAAPATTTGSVLIAWPASYSTMFGLSRTDLPRTSTCSAASPRPMTSARSTE